MRWALHTFACLALGLSAAACVGDTATPNPADSGIAGEEGSACYPDETCNKNKPWLKCLSKLCVNVGSDGGPDATSNDGGGADGSGADASDGSIFCASQVQSVGSSVRCVNGLGCTDKCCFQSNTFACQSTCSAGPPATLACDDEADCPSAHCCLAAEISQLACPVVLKNTGGSMCITACPVSAIQMCGLGDKCPGNKQCVKTTLGSNEYGICVE